MRRGTSQIGDTATQEAVPSLLDPEPLLRVVDEVGLHEAAAAYATWWGTSEVTPLRAIWRMRTERRRLKLDSADRWCVALGVHLAELWPEVYR